MARQIRYIIPEVPHHIMQRGNNHQIIFFDQVDRKFFCKNLKKYGEEENVQIGSYCLMTNHIHLLLYPSSEKGLINFMKLTSQLYTQYINWKYKRSGKLWENRYKLHLVDPECEWVIARYIELNPVRAGMVGRAIDYEYSSARKNINGAIDHVISRDIIKSKYVDYQNFVNENAGDLEKISLALQQGKAFGGSSFIEKIEKMFDTVFSIRKRGRPKNK